MKKFVLIVAAGAVAWALFAWSAREAPATAPPGAVPGSATHGAEPRAPSDTGPSVAAAKALATAQASDTAATTGGSRREESASDTFPASRTPRPTPAKVSRARPSDGMPRAPVADPLDDPALLAAAREIEDGLLRDNALDAAAVRSALQPEAFDATLDAFTQQGFADPAAERMTDLLRGQLIVQLGEQGGRLDRFACGRVLCAARYRFPDGAPPEVDLPVSGAIRRLETPAGTLILAIFSTDDRVDAVVVPRTGG